MTQTRPDDLDRALEVARKTSGDEPPYETDNSELLDEYEAKIAGLVEVNAELLAALKQLLFETVDALSMFDHDGTLKDECAIKNARAAIAKAEAQ